MNCKRIFCEKFLSTINRHFFRSFSTKNLINPRIIQKARIKNGYREYRKNIERMWTYIWFGQALCCGGSLTYGIAHKHEINPILLPFIFIAGSLSGLTILPTPFIFGEAIRILNEKKK